MAFRDTYNRLERLAYLVKRGHTGTVKDLSEKLQISPRTVTNDLDQLRDWGAEIEYCKIRKSYYYNTVPDIDFRIFRSREFSQ